MQKIVNHPILDIEEVKKRKFLFNGKEIEGEYGYTIAAALHQAGYPVHSHSIENRERSLECGIGKCGACEMLVDGQIKRICVTRVDDINEVEEISKDNMPQPREYPVSKTTKIYKTEVVIIGAGPAGLACREFLNEQEIPNIVLDNNATIGGQFNMQTHQFFFFEKEKKYGGLRGFDISKTLAGDIHVCIILNSTVWDLLEDKRVAVKNIVTDEVFYIDAEFLVVATGAVPFVPTFENDDIPGVYTAAVFQKMMNVEHTLLGKKILTIGAGNIGYLTSYQAFQAGAEVKAIVEAQSHEGGFPVQANRVRRLGIPILTSHMLLKAIPNENRDGVIGAVIAECENFKAIPGTEKIISDIDVINICTGLVPDDQLLIKGKEVFGIRAYGVGDSIRIGEGTSAVLRGKQAAMEIAMELGKRANYNDYLMLSKEYIDSQQHPTRVLQEPNIPQKERMENKGFVVTDCLYGFACNPCTFACPFGAITKPSTSDVPTVDYDKCIGCMECVSQCPGLAIFGYNLKREWLFLPIEYHVEEGAEVYLIDNNGEILGDAIVEKILKKSNKTNVARVKSLSLKGEEMVKARGFIVKEAYPKPLEMSPVEVEIPSETYVCHCDDVKLGEVLDIVGERKFISIDEIKHTTRLGMGPCRGKRCIPRLKQDMRRFGITVVGDATPRGPLSNQVSLGETYPNDTKAEIITSLGGQKAKRVEVEVVIAGGGIAGSALFRYFAEAGKKPVMINWERGGSWRNIAGGRPTFSNPHISDIARHNLEIFKDIQKETNIDFKLTRYVNFAHDDATYRALDESRQWSDAFMIDPKDFATEVSPYFNPKLDKYISALITNECWQSTPGKVIDFIRRKGENQGGKIYEDAEVMEVWKEGDKTVVLVKTHNKEYIEFVGAHFVNALGWGSEKFAHSLGLDIGLYPVKHQAFITRRLPNLGKNKDSLDMLIDRREYKGFSAVYGQQLYETGQIIGCASPLVDAQETWKNRRINSKDFLEIVSEVFVDWIPNLASVGFQSVWSGYYVEPRYIVDPENGLLTGLRGHGYMLGMYLAKLYVDKYLGIDVPSFMKDLALNGEGLHEKAFK